MVALRKRKNENITKKVLILGLFVVVAGMMFGKYGFHLGLPWWIYYSVPMLITVFFPPVYFKMSKTEFPVYLVLSFLSAPFIHVLFSGFLGWKDYMPFIPVPSLWEL
ncbi:MAG: hypothetical protein ACRD6X_09105 [Pyrinomonadaceae bacterium]